MHEEPFAPGAGCLESYCDARTIEHTDVFPVMSVAPLVQGGHVYQATDIEHQHKVGICTSIALTQNARRALGEKFSADFLYLLQKKYIDLNWIEGSSILSALKAAKRYGLLPSDAWTHTTEADRNLSYDEYIAKLRAIPDAEVTRLLALCRPVLSGYASVPNDPQAIAKAVNDSRSGVICMYRIGATWYTSPSGVLSWAPRDINPLRVPNPIISGHAITLASFDYSATLSQVLANTWGATWDVEGCGDIDWNRYQPREVWIPYYILPADQQQQLDQALEAKKDNPPAPVPSPYVPDSVAIPFLTTIRNIWQWIVQWKKDHPTS